MNGEWDHVLEDADWEYNTDNANDYVVEAIEAPEKSSLASKVVRRSPVREGSKILNQGVRRLSFDGDRTLDTEESIEDMHLNEDESEVVDVKDDGDDEFVLQDQENEDEEKEGYFAKADSSELLEHDVDVHYNGLEGSIFDVAPIHGETYAGIKMDNGMQIYVHWRDIEIYHPSDDELIRSVSPPLITPKNEND